MRADDQTPPTVAVDGHERPPWMVGRLVVALEMLPQAAYVWDDADPAVVWDDPDPDRFVWDAPFVGEGFTDAWCDLVRLELIHGEPTTTDAYRTGYALVELRDPGDGRYRARTADGRLLFFAPGRRLAVYWLDPDGEPWWLFSGAIATWRDTLSRSESVVIEAFTGTGQLARPFGRAWTAGGVNDWPGERLAAIAAAYGYTGPTRFDLGDVRLAVPEAADVLGLDRLRQAAASDGGIVYSDADDTLIGRDRRWRDGRPDQLDVPVFTDNVCDVAADAVVVWDPVAADVDERLAGTVRLENIADPPLVAVALGGPYVDRAIVFTHDYRDLWQTLEDGYALAAHIADVRSTARLALASLDVALHDVRWDYWRQTLDRRLGDRIRFVHEDRFTDPDRVELYDLALVLTTIRHTITADQWVAQLGTSPAVDYTTVELWDVTALTYDDPSELAVWR